EPFEVIAVVGPGGDRVPRRPELAARGRRGCEEVGYVRDSGWLAGSRWGEDWVPVAMREPMNQIEHGRRKRRPPRSTASERSVRTVTEQDDRFARGCRSPHGRGPRWAQVSYCRDPAIVGGNAVCRGRGSEALAERRRCDRRRPDQRGSHGRGTELEPRD